MDRWIGGEGGKGEGRGCVGDRAWGRGGVGSEPNHQGPGGVRRFTGCDSQSLARGASFSDREDRETCSCAASVSLLLFVASGKERAEGRGDSRLCEGMEGMID